MKISEERIYGAEFASNPYLLTVDGGPVVGAHELGFKHGIEFCKKEIAEWLKEKLSWYESAQKLPVPEIKVKISTLKELIEDLEKEN